MERSKHLAQFEYVERRGRMDEGQGGKRKREGDREGGMSLGEDGVRRK